MKKCYLPHVVNSTHRRLPHAVDSTHRCIPFRLSSSTSAFKMSSSASPKLNLTFGPLKPLSREHIGSKPYHCCTGDYVTIWTIRLHQGMVSLISTDGIF
ncbi:hypothetical protein DEO72_LG3g579 [Vigna unguiculata]|uniref:Uncharacterized protein n=1 Tax=Vigna unguiculata TaxID=3917 RepID=A0A4D6LBY0_VIGUN|nr:hypothetical protein DEO72_LG3g579 [Vigna unguiculata]